MFHRRTTNLLRTGMAGLLLLTAACRDRVDVDAMRRQLTPPPSSPVSNDVTSVPEGEPIVAVLTSPPEVPPPTNRKKPARVIAKLTVKELVMSMADGVQYLYWAFGGTVPGSFIRVRQGDLVEFHLQNHASSKMPHNIDLHPVTGPGGGAESSFTAPEHAS